MAGQLRTDNLLVLYLKAVKVAPTVANAPRAAFPSALKRRPLQQPLIRVVGVPPGSVETRSGAALSLRDAASSLAQQGMFRAITILMAVIR
jgi:hypothetical protein